MEARDQMMSQGPMPSQESASLMGREPEPVEPPATEGGEIRNVSIRPAANGGFIVAVDRVETNEKGLGSMPKDSVFADVGALIAFLQETFV